MAKRKSNKKRNIGIIIGVIFLILIVGLIAINATQLPIDKNYDESIDGDIVEISIQQLRFVDKIFLLLGFTKQAAFDPGKINLGNEVNVYDFIPSDYEKSHLGKTYKIYNIRRAKFEISKKVGSGWLKYSTVSASITKNTGNDMIIRLKFKPSEVGEYKASTILEFCDINLNCVELYYTETPNINVLTVVPTTTTVTCDLSPSATNWVRIDSIDNGYIEKRDITEVNDDCSDFEILRTEKRIVCNTGYLVDGTQSYFAPYSGSETCVSKEPEQDISPTIDMSPEDDTLPEQDTTPDQDTASTCGDGICDDTENYITCSDDCEKPLIDEDEIDEKDKFFNDKTIQIFMIIGIIIIIILVILIIKKYRRTRR